jgi:hypothetical protein
MKKSEWFALLAGIIGFIADFIAITLFFGQRAALTTSDNPPPLVRLQALVIYTMIYGWFITSWTLVRRHWSRAREKGSKTIKYSSGVSAQNELFRRVSYTVAGIGLFILPFSMRLPINDRIPARDIIQWFSASLGANLLVLAIVGSAIVFAISSLMPIVYDDLFEMFE